MIMGARRFLSAAGGALALLGALAGTFVPARAATWKGRELQWRWRDATVVVGPVRMTPRFRLSDAGYDSNVFYYSREEPVRDYTFTAAPSVDIYVPIRRKVILSLSEAPSYLYYLDSTGERAWNNALEANLIVNFNKIFISAGGGWTSARQRWNSEIDLKPRLTVGSYRAELLVQLTRTFSLGVAGRRQKFDFADLVIEDANIRDRLNRVESAVETTAYLQPTARMRWFAAFEAGRYTFQNPASGMDSTSVRWSGGVELLPPGTVQGRIRAGWKSLVTAAPGRPDFRGFVAEADIRLTPVKPLTLRAGLRRDPLFSIWFDNSFFVETRVRGGVSILVAPAVRLDYDFERGVNDYSTETPGLVEPTPGRDVSKRRDDYTNHIVGVSVRVAPKTWVGVAWNAWGRHSNLEWENNSRAFTGFSLTHDF